MFWLVDDLLDTVWDFVSDPVRTTAKIVTQPLRDTLDIVDWLTEWELRVKAIARLWTDVAVWMTASELIDWYKE